MRAYAAGAVEETMNGGGILLREKDYVRTAVLLDQLNKDFSFRQKVLDSQKNALQKYSRENVSRILLDFIKKVTG